jgi:hypothetical protein
MDLIGIGSIIEGVGKVAGDLITTDKERLQMALEERKLDLEEKKIDQATDLAQVEINKIEAGSASVFVAGWRPAVGWVGVAGLAYQFLGYPLMQWIWAFGQGVDLIPKSLAPPPDLQTDQLMVLLSGLLGFGGMRSFEKSKGVAAK